MQNNQTGNQLMAMLKALSEFEDNSQNIDNTGNELAIAS